MGLEEFITGILAGSASYPVARFLFSELVPATTNAKAKRLLSYIVSFALAVVALSIGSYLGYADVSPETTFTAFVTAFSTATALHGVFELNGNHDA